MVMVEEISRSSGLEDFELFAYGLLNPDDDEEEYGGLDEFEDLAEDLLDPDDGGCN